MRTLLALSFVFLGACASSSGDTEPSTASANQKKGSMKPQIQIVQTSGLAIAARHMDGAFSVRYAVRVTNPSADQITLRRVTVQTVTEGAYHIDPFSMPFEVAVAAAQAQDVQFWAPAETGYSVIGANGPVTLRVVCEFDSKAGGRFQEVVMRVVNHRASVTGE